MKVEAWDKLKALFPANWKTGVTHRLTVTEMLRSNVSKTVKRSGSVLGGAFMSSASPTHPLPVQAWRETGGGSLWPAARISLPGCSDDIVSADLNPAALRVDLWPLRYTWKATKFFKRRGDAAADFCWQFSLETLLPRSLWTRQTCAAEALWWTSLNGEK